MFPRGRWILNEVCQVHEVQRKGDFSPFSGRRTDWPTNQIPGIWVALAVIGHSAWIARCLTGDVSEPRVNPPVGSIIPRIFSLAFVDKWCTNPALLSLPFQKVRLIGCWVPWEPMKKPSKNKSRVRGSRKNKKKKKATNRFSRTWQTQTVFFLLFFFLPQAFLFWVFRKGTPNPCQPLAMSVRKSSHHPSLFVRIYYHKCLGITSLHKYANELEMKEALERNTAIGELSKEPHKDEVRTNKKKGRTYR